MARDEPRPLCPECGQVVHPAVAFPFGEPRELREVPLTGIYCSADCLLDAYERGFPKSRVGY